jgi:LL-diaminopimelate aminotransferase
MQFKESERLRILQPYLFAEIDKIINKKRKQGLDVISLGIGDPDIPTPEEIIETLCREANNPENHRYPSSYGLKIFKEAVAEFYFQRFNVTLNPDREVIPLFGSKEGISDIAYTYINNGDYAIMTDPSYLVYRISTIFAGGIPYMIPLKKDNDFLFNPGDIKAEIADKAKILYINYPNNPTTATCGIRFFKKVADFAEKNNIIVCHDNAYSDIYSGEGRPISFLNAEGSINTGVELNSLSKTFNMTGWRIGYAVGNEEIIKSIGKYKTNVDSGVFNAVQFAAAKALSSFEKHADYNNQVYKKRREMVKKALDDVGIDYHDSDATIYVWVEVPEESTSESFSKMLLEKANVVVTPGNAFGKYGEGFIRISLTVKDERLEEALNRIKDVL